MQVAVFDDGVEFLEHFPVGFGLFDFPAEVVNDGFVVLVHEEHNAVVFCRKALEDFTEFFFQRFFLYAQIVLLADIIQKLVQGSLQTQRFIAYAAERDVQDGICFIPIPLVFNPQPLEKFFAAAEQLLHGADQQGFTEASRAGEEVVLAGGDQLVDVPGLVHVQVPAGAQF